MALEIRVTGYGLQVTAPAVCPSSARPSLFGSD